MVFNYGIEVLTKSNDPLRNKVADLLRVALDLLGGEDIPLPLEGQPTETSSLAPLAVPQLPAIDSMTYPTLSGFSPAKALEPTTDYEDGIDRSPMHEAELDDAFTHAIIRYKSPLENSMHRVDVSHLSRKKQAQFFASIEAKTQENSAPVSITFPNGITVQRTPKFIYRQTPDGPRATYLTIQSDARTELNEDLSHLTRVMFQHNLPIDIYFSKLMSAARTGLYTYPSIVRHVLETLDSYIDVKTDVALNANKREFTFGFSRVDNPKSSGYLMYAFDPPSGKFTLKHTLVLRSPIDLPPRLTLEEFAGTYAGMLALCLPVEDALK